MQRYVFRHRRRRQGEAAMLAAARASRMIFFMIAFLSEDASGEREIERAAKRGPL